MVGSIVLSDDQRSLLYDEIDTSNNVSRIVLLDLADHSKKIIRSSTSITFVAAQFLHNSNDIVFIEKKKNTSLTNIAVISQVDTSTYKVKGIASGIMDFFPKISRGNLFPSISSSFYFELIDLGTGHTIALNSLAFDNELLISGDGALCATSGIGTQSEIIFYNVLNAPPNVVKISVGLGSVYLFDMTCDGNKTLFLAARTVNANNQSIDSPY